MRNAWSIWHSVVVWLAVAGSMLAMPRFAADQARLAVHQLFAPGQLLVQRGEQALSGWWAEHVARTTERDQLIAGELSRQLRQAEDRIRELELAQPAADSATTADDVLDPLRSRVRRLFRIERIPAAVLGQEITARLKAGQFVAAGRTDGLQEHAWVFESNPALIDLGADFGLRPAEPIAAGQTVIGKVHRVGQRTSSLMRVDDPAFRCRAQLVRRGSSGPQLGPRGLLKGNGSGQCLLEGISSDDDVRVGDEVLSADRDGVLPLPFYLGRVRSAVVRPEDQNWQIIVEAASVPDPLTTVDVLRISPNGERLSAN